MRAILAMTAAVVLAGCQIAIPDFRPGSPSGGVADSGGGGFGAAGTDIARAEQACRAVAAERGLTVNGIQETREVTDSGGFVTGRDVFLRVTRSGQTYTVRCSYTTTTDEARLMVL
jgi:hypothetical protein